jgi:hypothetical protein
MAWVIDAPRQEERLIRIDGIGEVPSIEVGTGHIVATPLAQQLAVVTLELDAALWTILADVFLFRFWFGKLSFGRGNFSLHRFRGSDKGADLIGVCAKFSRMVG